MHTAYAHVCWTSRTFSIHCTCLTRRQYMAVKCTHYTLLIVSSNHNHCTMAIMEESHPLYKSAEDFEAMHEGVRHHAPALDKGANAGSSTDVTDNTPSLTRPQPASPQHQFDDILDDPEYDHISDIVELGKNHLVYNRDPGAIRRHAMAADFSEGRLETFVGSPQKELAGTQNQYVSYQVTTKVCLCPQLHYPYMFSV